MAAKSNNKKQNNKKHMFWSETHNVILLREILVTKPYKYAKRTSDSVDAWNYVAGVLDKCAEPKCRTPTRNPSKIISTF